jgi:hypothetical protein
MIGSIEFKKAWMVYAISAVPCSTKRNPRKDDIRTALSNEIPSGVCLLIASLPAYLIFHLIT